MLRVHPATLGFRPRFTLVLLLTTLLLPGCASVGTLSAWMRGEVILTEGDLQRRLERRFPRDFKLMDDSVTLTLSQPQATLPRDPDQLVLVFDMQLKSAALRVQPRGQFALASTLRYDPATYSLYLHEPSLVTLNLPLTSQLQGERLKAAGNELLAEYARSQPIYQLTERQKQQIPRGRSIDSVDIENGRIIIRLSR
jgi:hypothetical protein